MENLACVTLSHPIILRNTLIFILRYMMAQKSDEVRKYVGWDLALTEKGWVLVEGNSGGSFVGFQLPIHKGFRDELNEICRKLK